MTTTSRETIRPDSPSPPERREGYRDTLRRLGAAQKSAKGGPAYSVYVNRRLGRATAAAAYLLGLMPNTVTVISACFSYAAIVVIALVAGWPAAVAAPLLAFGYVLDAADGQLARLRGGGSLTGEWLDHMADAIKITALHLAVIIHLYRFTDLDRAWLLVPMGYIVVGVALFFAQLLNEQLRRNRAATPPPGTLAPVEKASPVVAILKLPHDYGVLCWVFVLLGAPELFLGVYGFLFVANAGYLGLALIKWYREMRTLDASEAR
jgi:phosphatidylglycerophosphate synthase